MKHASRIKVSANGGLAGWLVEDGRNQIWFEYDPQWIDSGFDLSPQTLTFSTAPQLAKDNLFDGLHGVFNDSLPDGWGLLLMDRALESGGGWSRTEITPLDRLAYIGSRAMGALEFEPEYEYAPIPDEVDLAEMASSSEAVLKGSEPEVLNQLRIQGGSPGGARPKVTIARSGHEDICLSGFRALPPGYEHWIVKFRSEQDPRDMGCLEKAYAEMACLAGVTMPKTDTIKVNKDRFFAVRRFDRGPNEERHHVLSLAGFLYANFRMPCLDYETVLQATSFLTKHSTEVERAFRLMVFNVMAHNKDDHAKNFAFIGGRDGWRLAPGFDLTFSGGMRNEHTTAVLASGNPGLQEIMRLAKKFHVNKAEQVVGEVRFATTRWAELASQWGVSKKTSEEVHKALSKIDQRFAAVPMQAFR